MKVKLYDYIDDCQKKVEKKEVDSSFVDNMLVWIQFFQHERFVHLLVTVFVGICTVLLFISALVIENIMLFALFVLLLALFVPYIFHYYNLENGVQKLYNVYHDAYQMIKKN